MQQVAFIPQLRAKAAPGSLWVLQGGQVYVLDVSTGSVVANIDGQGQRPQAEWIADARNNHTSTRD
jgi:hypothetical protein